MTCTSIVWNQFRNWIGITKKFIIILGLQKFFKSISYSKLDLEIFKMAKLYNKKHVASSNMFKGVILFCKYPFDQGLVDLKSLFTTWNHFLNFLIAFWIRNEIWKLFGILEWFWKFLVIWIQFWNYFQTIEVQVISLQI